MDEPSIPGYEGLKPIGKGGFSRVFEATQQKFRRQVAIKVLNFGVNDEENRRAFARETQLMGRVSTHPNIVTVYDTAFTDQGQPCIVMELCSGGTIAERVQDVGGLPIRDVLDVGVAIASALHASHSSGVLHRDIKPQNILISDFGQPALSDFGISAFDDDRAQTGDATGFTLHYAAPEVIEGEQATAQSDVYSLAATLYTAAAGQRPFATPGTKLRPGELARRVLLEEPASLTTWGVPAEIDAVIAQAMSKEAAHRPATAQDFADALTATYPSLNAPARPADTASDGAAGTGTEHAVSPPVEDAPNSGDDGPTVPRKEFEEQRRAEERDLDNHLAAADPEADLDPVGRSRWWMAVALPIAAILVAGGAILAFKDRGTTPEVTAPPTPNASAAVDPPRAPERPTDVVLERLTPGEVTVRWSSADAGDESVTFEMRRSDIEAPVVRTLATEAVLSGIASNEQPCVQLLTARGTRLSNQTDPVCASLASAWVEVLPNTCAINSCSVRLQVFGLPDDSKVNLVITDPSDADLNGFAPDAYETSAELNNDGDVIDWRLTLGNQLDTGRYRVQVSDDVGIAAIGFFDVTE